MDQIKTHFKKVDPVMFNLSAQYPDRLVLTPRTTHDYFIDLIDSIISQQLSVKAAATIYKRFEALFPNGKITSEYLLTIKDDDIRAAGISYPKIKYLKDLATKTINKEVELNKLDSLSNEEIVQELTRVKGIGQWTAEMFLMFTLGREDIFSAGDLGLKNAMIKVYNLNNPSREELEKIAENWAPYRSYACKLLWATLNNTPA